MPDPDKICALVLAADRTTPDAVAVAAGTPCKAVAPVAGVPMLERVLSALEESGLVDSILLCGPPRTVVESTPSLASRIATGEVGWMENASTPSASALAGLAALPQSRPVLVTTADHALLRAEIVREFVRRALASGNDLVAGVADMDTVTARFPGVRRTATRFRGGAYCGCNLFLFRTPRGRVLAEFWRRVEHERKRPWRVVVGALGPLAVLRYVLRRLTLDQALRRLSRRVNARVGVILLPYAEAAVDVDTPADLHFVEAVLRAAADDPSQSATSDPAASRSAG